MTYYVLQSTGPVTVNSISGQYDNVFEPRRKARRLFIEVLVMVISGKWNWNRCPYLSTTETVSEAPF